MYSSYFKSIYPSIQIRVFYLTTIVYPRWECVVSSLTDIIISYPLNECSSIPSLKLSSNSSQSILVLYDFKSLVTVVWLIPYLFATSFILTLYFSDLTICFGFSTSWTNVS